MTSTPPRFLQIADTLRARILSGELAAGDPLPSQAKLAGAERVARETVRRALAELRDEGLIVERERAVPIVRARTPPRRLGHDRYRITGNTTPSTLDLGLTLDEARRPEVLIDRVPADAELATLMNLAAGEAVLRRRYLFFDGPRRTHLSTSYLPGALTAGTPVEDPRREPWPGGSIAQLASLGVQVTHVDESPRARLSSDEEAQQLRIAPRIPVLAIRRIMWAGDRPVEVARDIVYPGYAVEAWYRVPVTRI